MAKWPLTWTTPWLPVPAPHLAANARLQAADPDSVLNGVRAFLHWRDAQPALREGSIRFIDAPGQLLAFIRESQSQRVMVVLNLSPTAVSMALPDFARGAVPVIGHRLAEGTLDARELRLPPHGAWYGTLPRGRA